MLPHKRKGIQSRPDFVKSQTPAKKREFILDTKPCEDFLETSTLVYETSQGQFLVARLVMMPTLMDMSVLEFFTGWLAQIHNLYIEM